VPLLQHPALFLDHHRVEERGHREPRQERRVLHRIPRPIPAPPQLDVGPPHAEADPDRKKQPRQQRPLANRDEPVGVETLLQYSRLPSGPRDSAGQVYKTGGLRLRYAARYSTLESCWNSAHSSETTATRSAAHIA